MANSVNYGAFPIDSSRSLTLAQEKPVSLGGVFCTTGGTLKIYDGTSNTGRVVLDTVTLASGYFPFPVNLKNGCYVEIGGGFKGTVLANL